MTKIRKNIYIDKDAYKQFKIKCVQEDKSVSEKINEFIIKTTQEKKENK